MTAKSGMIRKVNEFAPMSIWMSKKGVVASLALGALGTCSVVGAIFMLWGHQTRRVTAKPEVVTLFAELRIRQEVAHLEYGSYRSSSATNSENAPWPLWPSTDGSKINLVPLPTEWTDLGVTPSQTAVYCSYVSIVGKSRDSTNVGPIAAKTFGYSAPDQDWYYLLAHCDMDSDPGLDSYYFLPSHDPWLFWVNDGH